MAGWRDLAGYWVDLKLGIVAFTGFSQDMLHVVLAVLIQLSFAWITKIPLASFRPVLLVGILELANELADVMYRGGWGALHPATKKDTIADVVLTMSAPLLIYLLANILKWKRSLGRSQTDHQA